MSKYKTTTKAGDYRTRCSEILIRNPNGRAATVQINEEQVVRLDDKERKLDSGRTIIIELDATTLGKSFPIRDPATDAIMPGQTATAWQVFGLIYSWVREQQVAQDATQPEVVV